MPTRPPSKDPAAIELEIDHLSALDVASLRAVWRTTFRRHGKGIPPGILLRMLAWHIQEKAYGGHDRATEKALNRYAKPDRGAEGTGRHMTAGTVLVREYQGARHTVTVSPEGFIWREQAYPSLSKVAQAITGVKWNGPRFFGLRRPKFAEIDQARGRA